MKITILGTGSAEGSPIILHQGEIEGEMSRLRTALLVEDNNRVILDCGPDIRQQILTKNIKRLDAIFITHQHFDHIWGVGDIAQLKWLGDIPFKVFVNSDTKIYMEKFFPWIHLPIEIYEFNKEYKFDDFTVIPREVKHSDKFKTAAFEIVKGNKEAFLYAPDFKGFSNYQGGSYKFTFVDGNYYFGKYIEDDDHFGKEELQKLIESLKAEKHYLLSVSPWWYKRNIDDLKKDLLPNLSIPEDFDSIDF